MKRPRPGHRLTLDPAQAHALAKPIRFEPLPDDGSTKIVTPGLARLMAKQGEPHGRAA